MTLIPLLPAYLDHGYKRHDPLHVFLQFRQGSQFTCNHLVVWKGPVVALDRHQEEKSRQGGNTINGKGAGIKRSICCSTAVWTCVRLLPSLYVSFSPCNACRAGIRHCAATEGSSWQHRWYSGKAWLGVLNHPSACWGK